MWFLFWRDHSKGWSKVEAERLFGSQPILAGDDGGLYEGLAVEKVSSDFPEIHLNNREDILRGSNVKDDGEWWTKKYEILPEHSGSTTCGCGRYWRRPAFCEFNCYVHSRMYRSGDHKRK